MPTPPVTWLTNGRLITPDGILRGAVGVRDGRIVEIARSRPSRGPQTNLRGQYLAPGFIDLHVWGDPRVVARQEVRTGTTGFLTTFGPDTPEALGARLSNFPALRRAAAGAACLGVHLEGPFLNPARAGALAGRWLRPPRLKELGQLHRAARGMLKLVTLAPELPGGLQAIRWCAEHGVAVSLGHSAASVEQAASASDAGARAVTHVFNGMAPFHHREPGLLGAALTDDRLSTMVILDGVHVSATAFTVLLRCKSPARLVLATDSIRHQRGAGAAQGPAALRAATSRGGAFYLPAATGTAQAGARAGTLAGSRLTMIEAVRNAVVFGKLSISDAVRMATRNPATLLGVERERGSLVVGRRADLVVFDERFRVQTTYVNGTAVWLRGR